MFRLFAVVGVVGVVAMASPARAQSGGSAVTTPTVELVLSFGNPDFIDLSKKRVSGADTGRRIERNLRSFVIAYKAWGQLGEFVATPQFYYEIDPGVLTGATRTVHYAQIAKYPDLAERYKAIRPTSVNYRLYADLWVKSLSGTRPVIFKVEDHQLVYFQSRSNRNYSSPGSPARWKYGVSQFAGPDAFTDRDRTDEREVKKWFRELYGSNARSGTNVDLDVKWPDAEIDDIHVTYLEYEKRQTELDERARKLRDDYRPPITPPARSGTDWDKPAPIPVNIELDQDLDNTTTKEGFVEISGKLQGPSLALESAKLVAMGYEQKFEVDADGRFRNKVILVSGMNRIELQVGSTVREQRITLDRKPSKLRATLTWREDGDVDLHMTSPGGTTVYYSKRSGDGMTLDVDDRDGYGPENIFVQPAEQGTYEIALVNYSANRSRTATVYIFVDEKHYKTKTIDLPASKTRVVVEQVKL